MNTRAIYQYSYTLNSTDLRKGRANKMTRQQGTIYNKSENCWTRIMLLCIYMFRAAQDLVVPTVVMESQADQDYLAHR